MAVTSFVSSQPLISNWTLSAVKLPQLASVEALTANVLSLHIVGVGFACVQGSLSHLLQLRAGGTGPAHSCARMALLSPPQELHISVLVLHVQ